MNPDFVALLRELSAAEARFLVVGGYAVSFHSRPRATGDLDVWVEPTTVNAVRVFQALRSFGAPLEGLAEADLTKPDVVYQIGVPPCRVDLLTSLTGLGFDEAWAQRVTSRVAGLDVPFIGRDALVRNKRALGRARDLADLEALEPGS
jgi:hypothetical protein